MVRLLLDHGADVNVPGCWTWTPVGSVLNAAIAQGFLDIARLLINRGAIITVQTVEYTMSMQVRGAGRSSQEEMMALLRERAPEAVMEYWVEQDGGLQGGPRE
jgi:ankyrin repeat protein